MKFAANALATLALASQATAVVDKWTPADFDWDRVHRVSREGVISQNVTASPPMSKELVVYAAERHNMTETQVHAIQVIGIAASIGWAVANPVTFAVGAASVAGAANGCIGAFNDPTFRNSFFCMLGLASTIGGFGGTHSRPTPHPHIVNAVLTRYFSSCQIRRQSHWRRRWPLLGPQQMARQRPRGHRARRLPEAARLEARSGLQPDLSQPQR